MSRSDRETSCPACAAGAERGQLVCLECGSRIALTYRRPPSWKVPLAISAVLLVLGGAGAVLAYQAVDDEAEREVAAVPAKIGGGAAKKDEDEPGGTDTAPAGESASDTETEGTETAEDQPEADTGTAEEAGELEKDGLLYTWPRSLQAFTVVLLSNEDRPSAVSFARSAAATRPEKIGVIRSDDFRTLPTGFFIVFAGTYAGRAAADRAAAQLAASFPGAFPQVVRR